MDLKEANKEIEKLDNDIDRLLNEKEILFGKTQPKAVDTTKDNVKGGTRSDKFQNYVESLEEKQLNEKIDKKYALRDNLLNWIDNELKILGKYNEIEQLIRYYKEDVMITDKYTGRSRELTWEEIGKEVHYSKTQCRRIYKMYKGIRNI